MCRNNIRIKRKDPVRCIQFNADEVRFQMVPKYFLVFHKKLLEIVCVFIQSRQVGHINVTHLIVFNEADEQPKCNLFRTMHQQTSNNKVHTLHVTNSTVVFAKRK